MNKTAVKNVATSARIELINQVALRAQSFGVTPSGAGLVETGSDYVLINDQRYPLSFQKPCEALCQEIKKKGFQQVVEEVAYTWFNRLAALRFMEVNDYLPSRIRVLSSLTPGKVDPDILALYREVDFPVDETYVQQMLQKGDREAAYRHLLIAQCNQLSQIMPFLFEKINHYTELLLPSPLLHADSFINRMVREIDEDDFREVEIIGWMYQYYISEKNKEIVGMNKGTVAKEDLPAATQLFTPKWIVQYMVQNSLGKMWFEHYPDSELVSGWEYFLRPSRDGAAEPGQVELEKIKVLDPACGSGHILVYAFDLLYEMYESQGYPAREIPDLILSKNLYGLDIDRRAAQLAGFALLMKARSKSTRLFRQEININVYDFKDAEKPSGEAMDYFCRNKDEVIEINALIGQFGNARSFGSLIVPLELDYEGYIQRLERLDIGEGDMFERSYTVELKEKLGPLFTQAKILKEKYHVVVTNPPYHNKYNPQMKEFILKNYADYKADLYSAFIYRCTGMTLPYGYCGMMTPFTWMFISTHEKLRLYILSNQSISSLVQLEYSAFKEATVPICTFLIQNQKVNTLGKFIRLTDFKGADLQPVKVREAVSNPNVSYRYVFDCRNFIDISGSPIGYWVSDQVRKVFKDNPRLGDLAEPRQGLATSDDTRFLRLWHEVSFIRIGFGFSNGESAKSSKYKWFPFNKGGDFRKWYGNQEYIINWENDGYEVKEYAAKLYKSYTRTIKNIPYYLREGITWTSISSANTSFRHVEPGFIYGHKGQGIFASDWNLLANILGLLNSKISRNFLNILSPTIGFESGYIKKIPVIKEIANDARNQIITLIVKNAIMISKTDWDSLETSWDFLCHPFQTCQNSTNQISQAFQSWSDHSEEQFRQMQSNEEELNRLIIKIYDLEDELTPEVPDSEITIRRADRGRDAKSFLSYAVGCIMGRYSLDVPGLAFAGGEFDWSKYKTFLPDPDGILPLTDKNYFEDDIIDRLGEFLKITFGEETLQENLYWLAESLILKQNETPPNRLRRYFLDEFYKDHVQTYQKRPIYWLFDSGRKKGFRALIYLHRYNPQTLAKLRLDYLQELQVKYSGEEKILLQRLEQANLSRAEKTAANRRLEELRQRQRELVDYDKQLADYANQRIDLDLDDGFVANYAKLELLLATLR